MSDEKAKGRAKGRRAQVANACITCRTAKLKCSGQHPTCARCRDRELVCEYDVSEGMTKRQQLRNDLSDRSLELERAMGVLTHMQQASDHEAAESLARLRIGSSIESEYLRIQSQRASRSPSSDGISRSHYSASTSNPDLDRTLASQNQRLLSLLNPAAQQQQQQQQQQAEQQSQPQQQPTTQANWSQSPNTAENWTATDRSDWRAHDYHSIDPQMLDQSGVPSRDPGLSSAGTSYPQHYPYRRHPEARP
ncbi:hypothetical protein CKM354_000652800 [Cercospora kikuchii]|uniref:Zn(2)-C6 fungal-type domain-containing protein n=1 Tax=Cercospora kikuchii TaxID=84275 RepID=A0A9P3CJJ7_9PEZI|nr:uncharacterized protein CKM354_000652800 [Cercospora kikuchii]GIZ43296.1 hypothetical protein CKM354_000652800 [Cercospora kikuchii]